MPVNVYTFLCSVVAEDTMDMFDSQDSGVAAMKNGQTSLLDSGEDFEVLNEEDIEDDDPPPLEDTGGRKVKNKEETRDNTDTEPAPTDEWLDVLGMFIIFGKMRVAGGHTAESNLI